MALISCPSLSMGFGLSSLATHCSQGCLLVDLCPILFQEIGCFPTGFWLIGRAGPDIFRQSAITSGQEYQFLGHVCESLYPFLLLNLDCNWGTLAFLPSLLEF
eukprot:GHVU01179783.1.p2 GENE.GHVU01179783.1~~GHVU01179783.1.p2  ORF type:complete len:103 (-),score=1.66 GHVU01179783.1:2-310(-)